MIWVIDATIRIGFLKAKTNEKTTHLVVLRYGWRVRQCELETVQPRPTMLNAAW